MWEKILQDALFAAIAAIGFAAISRPPARAYIYCAAIAAIGHSIRFVLMSPDCGSPLHIVPATLIASFAVGLLAVIFSPIVRTPPETCFFPALLPMIPGMYAYRTFGAACAQRKPGGIQPVFLSVRLQLLHMYMPIAVYGSRGHTASLHVQENILPRNQKYHPLETFRYLCVASYP